MSSLQSCDILFRKGSGWIARIIQYFTRSPYSHTALVVDNFHLAEINYSFRMKVRHLRYNSDSYDIYRMDGLTEEQKIKIIEFIKNQFQKEYDWKYFLSRGLNLLFDTKVYNSEGKYNCDELIVRAFQHAGIELVEDEAILTPGNLAKSNLLRKVV